MQLKGVEIFRVGTWSGSRKVEVTSGMLDQIVSNFAELNSKISGFGVPIKLGHNNKVGEPAYGWATQVYRQGDVALADFSDVPPELVDRIGKRQYNSVSIELYPVVPYDGKTFHNVLSGVALLGAEWPAVKGLKPLSEAESLFSEPAEKLVFTQEVIDPMLKFTQEDADALVLAAETRVRTEMQGAVTAAEQAKETAETELSTARAALTVFKTEAELAAFATLIDAAIAEGKVLPKSKDAYVAMAATFAGKTSEKVKFGAAEVTPVELFKSFLDTLPVVVKFGENGKAIVEKPEATGEKAADRVNAKASELTAADPKLSYEDAVVRVFAADPDLKAEYIQENA
jgi:hypothetical protein